MRRLSPVTALVMLLVFVTVACGDGQNVADGAAAATDAGGTLTASAGDAFAFDESQWTVPSGAVTVTFSTTGAMPHSFAVVPEGETVTDVESFDIESALLFVDLEGNDQGSDSATLEPGSYQVICTVPGHLPGGMEGRLTVTET